MWAGAPLEGDEDRFVNDPYRGGELLIDGEPARGDLAFRVIGSGGLAALPGSVAEILRAGVARLANDAGFAAGWLMLLAGAVALAVWGLRRPPRQLRDGGPGE